MRTYDPQDEELDYSCGFKLKRIINEAKQFGIFVIISNKSTTNHEPWTNINCKIEKIKPSIIEEIKQITSSKEGK